jgi:hypothetical protein
MEIRMGGCIKALFLIVGVQLLVASAASALGMGHRECFILGVLASVAYTAGDRAITASRENGEFLR